MSLFGNSSNLFGNAKNTFGSNAQTGTPATAPTAGMFGAANPAAGASNLGGGFSAFNTAGANTGGLSGGLNTGQTSAFSTRATAGGLGGGLNAGGLNAGGLGGGLNAGGPGGLGGGLNAGGPNAGGLGGGLSGGLNAGGLGGGLNAGGFNAGGLGGGLNAGGFGGLGGLNAGRQGLNTNLGALSNLPTLNAASGAQFGAGIAGLIPTTTASTANAFSTTAASLAANTLNNQQQGDSLFGGFPTLGASIVKSLPPEVLQARLNVGQLALLNGQSAYFDDMLRRTRRGQKDEDEEDKKKPVTAPVMSQFETIPNLRLGLGDIAERVKQIGTDSSATKARIDPTAESAARYMLAASGVPATSTLRELESIAQKVGTVPTQPVVEADHNIDGYVSGLASQTTLDIISDGLDQAKRDFDSFLQENVQIQWDAQRRRIYEHLGLAKPSDDDEPPNKSAFGQSARQSRPFGRTSTFGNIGARRSVIGNPSMAVSTLGRSIGPGREGPKPVPLSHYDLALIREKQETYMQHVHGLNAARNRQMLYPLLHMFRVVEVGPNLDGEMILLDAFNALINLCAEQKTEVRSRGGLKAPRLFQPQYLLDKPDSAADFRTKVIRSSRRALERSFMTRVENAITRDPKEAKVGGLPSGIDYIRAYIRLQMAHKEFGTDEMISQLQTLNDDYLWLLIYLMLRAGLYDEASQFVASNRRAIQGIDRFFPQVIAYYAQDPDHVLSPDLSTAVAREWELQKKYPQDQVDPYRMACYKVIGRMELERRTVPNIVFGHDDWLWLQFALARETSPVDEIGSAVFKLEGLRHSVIEIGNRHFSGGPESIDSPLTYFTMLVLAGLYEKAVAWLYDFNPVTATHFAIALNYYGLLRVSDISQTDLLSAQSNGTWKINFGLIIGHYTVDFRAAKPEHAVDYLTLIALDADLPGQTGEKQVLLCHEALRELVLETREFTLLLGDIREGGSIERGVIEQRISLLHMSNHDDFIRRISIQAASVAEDCGRVNDAVIMYHLANDKGSVIRVLSHVLADLICTDLNEDQPASDPKKARERVEQVRAHLSRSAGSLSLTAIHNPIDLAERMLELYGHSIDLTSPDTMLSYEMSEEVVLVTLIKLARARWWLSIATATSGIDPDQASFPDETQEESKARDAIAWSSAWSRSLGLVTDTGLLPLTTNGDVNKIRRKAAASDRLPAELTRTIGPVLLFTVTTASHGRNQIRSSPYRDQVRMNRLEELQQNARDLLVFAGLVRYRLETRVFEALAAIGGDMD